MAGRSSRNSVGVRFLAIVEDGGVSSPVITAAGKEWIGPFTGLSQSQFRKLVRVIAERGGTEIADGRQRRQWALE